ncbi:hypothetical protein GCM10017608_02420 [Agromyces luteolus]|nr:hypothetical protein GCM10017608_02420 [Agromyces luteolus]
MQLGANDLAALEAVVQAEPGHPIGPADLARRLDVSTAAATGVVDRLEARGHLLRRPHATDRRRIVLEMTPSADAAVEEALIPLLAALGGVEERFDAEEQRVIVRYLGEILEVWRRFSVAPE